MTYNPSQVRLVNKASKVADMLPNGGSHIEFNLETDSIFTHSVWTTRGGRWSIRDKLE